MYNRGENRGDIMNVVLIGMPGCGKSTIGVLLAKAMLYNFLDTDLVIQNKFSKTLSQIIKEEGIEAFKEKENVVLSEIRCENSIVATGGSAVYGKEAMQNLKQNAKVVYLKLAPSEIEARIKNIKTRGIAMQEGTSIEELYNERAPLYERYADKIVCCSGKTIEECVNDIIKALG